jgi:hypothetical protein
VLLTEAEAATALMALSARWIRAVRETRRSRRSQAKAWHELEDERARLLDSLDHRDPAMHRLAAVLDRLRWLTLRRIAIEDAAPLAAIGHRYAELRATREADDERSLDVLLAEMNGLAVLGPSEAQPTTRDARRSVADEFAYLQELQAAGDRPPTSSARPHGLPGAHPGDHPAARSHER